MSKKIWLLVVMMMSLLVCVPAVIFAGEVITIPYPGIKHLHRSTENPKWDIHAVMIDLTQPGLSYIVTPEDASPSTISAFAERFKTNVAINCDFFKMDRKHLPQRKGIFSTQGLTVSMGKQWTNCNYGYGPTKDMWSLLISKTGEAKIVRNPQTKSEGDEMFNVASGYLSLVIDGVIKKYTDDIRHPRTAAGLTQDNKTLILVVVDGRQPNLSVGMSLKELAALMFDLGCYQAFNFDGGGSTSMFIPREGGVVNSPSDPTGERTDANHFGVILNLPTDWSDFSVSKDGTIWSSSDTKINSSTAKCMIKVQNISQGIINGASRPKYDENTRAVYHFVRKKERMHDSSFYQNHITSGSAYNVPAMFDTAASFDGVDDYYALRRNSTLQPQQNSFTIESWIRVEDLTATPRTILSCGDNSQGYSIVITTASGQLMLDFNICTTEKLCTASAPAELLCNTSWHYLACVYDNQNSYIYIDGKQAAVSPVTGTEIKYSEDMYLYFGTEKMNADRNGVNPFKGDLDEVRISVVSRSADEILANYSSARYCIDNKWYPAKYCSGISGSADKETIFTDEIKLKPGKNEIKFAVLDKVGNELVSPVYEIYAETTLSVPVNIKSR